MRKIILEAIQNAIDNSGKFNWDRTPKDMIEEMIEYGVEGLTSKTRAEQVMADILIQHLRERITELETQVAAYENMPLAT